MLDQALEFSQTRRGEVEREAVARGGDASGAVETPGQACGSVEMLGGYALASAGRAISRAAHGDRGLELADGPALVVGAECEVSSGGRIGDRDQRLAVSLAEAAGVDEVDRIVGQFEQAHRVGDVRAAAAAE